MGPYSGAQNSKAPFTLLETEEKWEQWEDPLF